MYPRNAASPERVSVGAVVQISDGAVQTSGVSIKVKPQGASASAGGGTTSYEEGAVAYLPTQAETDYTSFQIIAYKTGCIPASVTVVTSASAVAGHAGVDWSKINAPTTAVNLSATNIDVDQVVASVSGAVGSVTGAVGSVTGNVGGNVTGSVGSVASGGITATSIAADAIGASELATDAVNEIASAVWAVATRSLTVLDEDSTTLDLDATIRAAVGLASANLDTQLSTIEAQTDDIGTAGAGLTALPWNAAWDAEVQSEVADALAAYGAATATDVTNAAANVSVDEIQVSALADLFNTNSGTTYASAVSGSVVKEIADNAGGSSLTAADIADAVWDEALSGHVGSGSTGEALSAAGGAGDPWITTLPGSYTSGQAGKIVGDYLNASVSSRATQTSVDDLPTNAELATALGTADDAVLTAIDALPTNAELATALASADDAVLSAIAALSIPTATQNADALLNRDMSAVSDTNARSPLNALRFIRNKWAISGSTLSVKKEDDTTEAWNAAVSTTPGADPVTGNDPA